VSTEIGRFDDAIARILPHRYPFLLVDKVTEFTPGKRIAGVKRFSANDFASQGLFPPAPVIPSAVLLETVTQLGAILVLAQPAMRDKIAMILQITSAEIREVVRPGDSLVIVAEVLRLGEAVGELKGTLYFESRLVAEGQMRFAIAPKPAGAPTRSAEETLR
jgi:3-hydroxyacyl-[acyl-carrier-protein] dehydratase